ncbi:MAG: hypothetical protein HYZ28_06970 [Myxococcales bacterium]|nr:hypothetical protein [Myxococcales bacterium]
MGHPFIIAGSIADVLDLGELIVTLSGAVRVDGNVALVSENWLMPILGRREFFLFESAAVRLIAERFSVDAGGVWTFSQRGLELGLVPMPWLSLTYQWPAD